MQKIFKTKSVIRLFNGDTPIVLSDSTDLVLKCQNLGIRAINLNSVEDLPENSLIFTFCDAAATLVSEKAKKSKNKKILFCATHVFEPSVEHAIYTLKLILGSNFHTALKLQKKLLEILSNHKTFRILGPKTSAKASLSDEAAPYALIEEDIKENFVHSIAEFFEVHYAHMNRLKPCPFCLSGSLEISGILTVLRTPSPSHPKDLKEKLKDLLECVAQHGAMLTVKDNIATSFKVNNREEIETLITAAGERGAHLTEFAIGVNQSIAPIIDFGVNSQMNEGIEGIHIAIGDGAKGYHIDFLSPGTQILVS
ncbi:hypothetical protein [Pseudomonas gingeri]|uniref:hypothetical protein n=1 Tax=Pseudomonas gingeri TaxID=117681 RepID=UPI0015A36C0E|nr:hypothetical protein [Pseudomonas gingeri]NWA08502.1 hypothetical protein [Pseudomonas gingeri]